MGDGGLASSSGSIEPKNNGVLIILPKDPLHDFFDDSGPGVWMALGGVECVSSVVKCAGCDCLLQTFKPT